MSVEKDVLYDKCMMTLLIKFLQEVHFFQNYFDLKFLDVFF